jgi:hypothetical protein
MTAKDYRLLAKALGTAFGHTSSITTSEVQFVKNEVLGHLIEEMKAASPYFNELLFLKAINARITEVTEAREEVAA